MSHIYRDQAAGLREEFSNTQTKIITVVSGKGGVGKSVLSVNIAADLATHGKRILLFDSDAGFANASILMGNTVKITLSEYMRGNVTFNECVQDTEFGVKIISSGFDFTDWKIFQNNFNDSIMDEFLNLLKEVDFFIIDVGAGYSEKLNNFYLNSDTIFLITVPEPTAVVNAYTLLKALSVLNVDGEIEIILNMIKNKNEVEMVKSVLSRTAKRFLNREINNFHEISYDENVHMSVKRQIPLISLKENSRFSKDIKKITSNILNIKTSSHSNFAQRLKEMFGKDH
ncbi:cobyrinic acid ac-diamide synthase [Petrotoga miotherma DSM 10691]|jgi:flagellar biosynthesis protein FlhG|uniref:Cobyrinic acid ac-diamide synthase n=1 Tax=Petrotoga miotherma DSM 10691 TaxID=1434326 RepID=A0A2K1P3F2_9BACT|nr:P-loop NTPase [Petrotoga miotherma]PNR97312.1 cobyrinic acid ac-diamide synthase [Petrotoga miotherma DSM 10691]